MLTPAEAEAAIAAVLEPVLQEYQALADSVGRVLRSPILAERDAPPFDRVTMDGIAYAVGDIDQMFTLQSISKPLVYATALMDHGQLFLSRKVGVEPSGGGGVCPGR